MYLVNEDHYWKITANSGNEVFGANDVTSACLAAPEESNRSGVSLETRPFACQVRWRWKISPQWKVGASTCRTHRDRNATSGRRPTQQTTVAGVDRNFRRRRPTTIVRHNSFRLRHSRSRCRRRTVEGRRSVSSPGSAAECIDDVVTATSGSLCRIQCADHESLATVHECLCQQRQTHICHLHTNVHARLTMT